VVSKPKRPALHDERRPIILPKLFVGNLSYDTTPDQLRELFSQAGEVTNVSMPTNRDNGRSRGFAFVEMATGEQAEAAIERFNGYELAGRNLRINEASKPAPWTSPFGGGGPADRPAFRPRPKGSRRNIRARKRGF
jgi:RNA recognition motif-containing protein